MFSNSHKRLMTPPEEQRPQKVRCLPEPSSHDSRHTEFEDVFNTRPEDVLERHTWHIRLRKSHGRSWYTEFMAWVMEKVNKQRESEPNYKIRNTRSVDLAQQFLPELITYSKQPRQSQIIHELLRRGYHRRIPIFYLGRYNDFSLGLALNGLAIDPPEPSFKIRYELNIQHTHPGMCIGLRCQEQQHDIKKLLVLGNVYANSTTYSLESVFRNSAPGYDECGDLSEQEWYDTKIPTTLLPDIDLGYGYGGWENTEFVLAMDLKSSEQPQYYLIRKYRVYETNYLDDGSEERIEEAEGQYQLKFCGDTKEFTVAKVEKLCLMMEKRTEPNIDEHSFHLSAISERKPEIVLLGYKDEESSYTPIILPRND